MPSPWRKGPTVNTTRAHEIWKTFPEREKDYVLSPRIQRVIELKKTGITQRAIAEEVGLSQSYVCQLIQRYG